MLRYVVALTILAGLFSSQVCYSLPFCPPDQEETIHFPHERCNKFYSCAFGVLTEHTCPEGTEYNPDKNSCDWPVPGGCLSSSSTSSTSTSSTTPSTTTSSTTPSTTTSSTTPSTTTSSTTPSTTTPSIPGVICPNNDSSITIIPHPEDCDKFYICFLGEPSLYICDDGMEFDPVSKQCIPLSESGCTANKPIGQCPSQGISTMPHPTDCTKFIVCSDGQPTEFQCDEGYSFDPVIMACVPASVSGCK